jgi:hypothetical protein
MPAGGTIPVDGARRGEHGGVREFGERAERGTSRRAGDAGTDARHLGGARRTGHGRTGGDQRVDGVMPGTDDLAAAGRRGPSAPAGEGRGHRGGHQKPGQQHRRAHHRDDPPQPGT